MPEAAGAALGLECEPWIEVDPWPWGLPESPVVSVSKHCKICWHVCSRTKIRELSVDVVESSSFRGEEFWAVETGGEIRAVPAAGGAAS